MNLSFLCVSSRKSEIIPAITLAVGQLSSNGYLHMKERIRKVDSLEVGIGVPRSELVNMSGVKFWNLGWGFA